MPRRLERSQARNLTVTFCTMAALILASVIITYQIGLRVIEVTQKIAHRHSITESLQQTLTTLVDAETGQRGYLLIGEEAYLQPYNDAMRRFDRELQHLHSLAATNVIAASDVAEIDRISALKLGELKQTIEQRRTIGLDAAAAIVRGDSGRQLMESLRGLFARLIAQQDSELAAMYAQAARATMLRTTVFVLTGLFNLFFLIWAFGRTRREMERSTSALDQLGEQKDLLDVTLRSIGDGVIVTDKQGQITFMNTMAERLTGWTTSESVGKPCKEVFRIINETSRQPVESPVDKVMQLGAIVGLANHTLLIRKDFKEIPIDDSGAPISYPDGSMRGVVLVFRDFTEHKQAEKELRKAKEEAEAANIAKDNFLATLSHELRTPLTPVLASLSLWSDAKELPPQLLSDIQMMRRNLELEARLIDDMLDLTRIVRGKLSLNMEVADLHKLISAVTDMYRSEIQGKQLRLALRLDAMKHYVRGDVGRMQQIFWNILKNAIKFTPTNGEIRIHTENDDQNRARVTISDTGIGIPAETLQRLFEPFQQGTDRIVRQYGGLGLGLAISKSLLEAQGGEIEADSRGTDQGATFTIVLPLTEAPPTDTAAAQPDASQLADRVANGSIRVLLVEDHLDTARVMGRLLSGFGYAVTIEGSVTGALQAIKQSEFDVLISDIGLPDGTGLDLMRQIREFKLTVPAIALTGYGMDEDITRCMEAGFNQHLTKPINFYNLEVLVRKLAAQARVK